MIDSRLAQIAQHVASWLAVAFTHCGGNEKGRDKIRAFEWVLCALPTQVAAELVSGFQALLGAVAVKSSIIPANDN